jgi:hypothetical protein
VPLTTSSLLEQQAVLGLDRSTGPSFCINQKFLNAIMRSSNSAWVPHNLEYVLKTGANWSGPIRNFRLVVDKGSPKNLVSFCGKGIRQISATQFGFRASDFTPTSNLSVLFLTPYQAEPGEVQ